MKPLTWDKLRRLVGGGRKNKKDGDKEIDSAKFQRSYSFKRGSIRKSAKRNALKPPAASVLAAASPASSTKQQHVRQRSRSPKPNGPITPRNDPGPGSSQSTSSAVATTAIVNPRPSRQRLPDLDDDDERTNWILMKQKEEEEQQLQKTPYKNVGRKELVEKFQRLLSSGDSDYVGDEDDNNLSSSSNGSPDHQKKSNGHHSHLIHETDFYTNSNSNGVATKQSTGDSALSRMTNSSFSSGHSNANNRIYHHSNLSSQQCISNGGGAGRSRSRLSMSALNLIDEAESLSTKQMETTRNRASSSSSNQITNSRSISNLTRIDSNTLLTTTSTDSVNYYLSQPAALDSGCFHSNYNSGKSSGILNGPCSSQIGMQASRSSDLNLSKYDDEDPPKSFWWTQKPGSTFTTSSAASRDSGFSLGRNGGTTSSNHGWAWGLANKMFGRNTKPKTVLSVSKEGYFQRTNLRRCSSGKKKSKRNSNKGSIRKKRSIQQQISPGLVPMPILPSRTPSTVEPIPFLQSVSQIQPESDCCTSISIDCTTNSSSSIYQYLCYENNPMMRRPKFGSSNDDQLPFIVLPQRRKSKASSAEVQTSNSSNNATSTENQEDENEDDDENDEKLIVATRNRKFNGHRFETIEIRLPRLKCHSLAVENNAYCIGGGGTAVNADYHHQHHPPDLKLDHSHYQNNQQTESCQQHLLDEELSSSYCNYCNAYCCVCCWEDYEIDDCSCENNNSVVIDMNNDNSNKSRICNKNKNKNKSAENENKTEFEAETCHHHNNHHQKHQRKREEGSRSLYENNNNDEMSLCLLNEMNTPQSPSSLASASAHYAAKNNNKPKIKVIVTKSSLRRRHSTTISRRKRRLIPNAAAAIAVAPGSSESSETTAASASRTGAAGEFMLPRPTIKLGDITQKGYEKKRSRLLAPYLPKQALAPKSNEGSASPSTRAKRRAHRRLTRNESRYHSEVRQEAVQQALAAMQSRPKPSLPMPSKRTSVMGRAPDHAQQESGDSSTDDDSIGNEEGELDDQDSSSPLEKDRDSRSGGAGSGGGSGSRTNRASNDTPTQQILIHSDSSSTGSNKKETPPMSRPPKLPERNKVSNGTPAGPVLTYSNLGNLTGGKLSWEERPAVIPSSVPAAAEQQPQHHHRDRHEGGGSRKSHAPANSLLQSPAAAALSSPAGAEPQSHLSSSHGQQQQLVQHRNNRSTAAEMTDLVEAMHNLRTHSSQSSQPPDVTSNAQSRRIAPADRLNRLNQKRSQSSSLDESSGTLTGTGRWKVSAKIQQLLNTLKRPKRRPLPEFYEDDDIELEMAAKNRDPNAPKPEGSIMSPAIGEQLVIPSGLPRNLEAAVQRYGSATFKAPVATVLDPNGKLTVTLSYGKLLSRSHKIAFALLNKTSHKGEIVLKSGDRVALVFPNNDPINFICAFYGCLFAGVVPVPIEVPLTRRGKPNPSIVMSRSSLPFSDAGSQQIGFLLGSCSVQVALTSEACLKGLPKTATGEVVAFKGWPKLSWFVTEHLGKTSKDFSPSPRVTDETSAYIEYATDRDGSVMGVTINRATMLAHCRSLTTACNYTEGENMVCVLDFKREVGLWHSILTSVFNGMHVVFIPYALMKVNPASWMQMITKYRASVAIVKSRDLHWGLLATRDHRDISLASLRLLLVSDGANPWSLSSCDQFLSVFQNKGLRPDAICPCASSSECLTVSLRRPGRAGVNATGRGVLSMQGLSHGVVRVDQENSLTSLTLQDCGQVMPGAVIVVVRMDGQPFICKTDEVGEICVHSSATGSHYWGLQGLTNNTFKIQPIQADGTVITEAEYVRSGLLGFLGPGGLVFVCGSRNGLMSVSGRKHNADDIIATVLAVEPMKFIYRGRIAVFSIKVLRDERICVIAEQRPDCSEEESFQWMSRVLQAVDSIHQVGIYCLVLVNPNCLPKTPLGGIHLSETKRKFLEGTLHPANVLMCPHTCVTNLPKPREIHSDIGPASVMVGNIVQGNRLATAHGRDLGVIDEESDSAKKYQFISEILKWRSTSTADHVIFTLLNSKGTATMTLTCSQLHKRAERVACLLLERAKINTGDHVALVYPPGLDLIAAFYGCLYAGAVPVTVRPPHPQNLQTTLPTVRMIAEVSKSVLILSTQNVIKLLKSKEASNVVDIKSWPLTLDTDDLPKKKLANLYRAPTAEMIAYLDFSVSTTGMLAGIKMSHAAVTSLCRSMKLACELYPSRHVALCLDPYCGLGLVLWSLSSVYSGHHSILIPPSEVEVNPALWLSAVSQYKVRDTFCSYGVMELCTKGLGSSVNLLKQRNVNLACVRTCVVVAEERPRINLTNSFSKLFSALGLSPRAVSTSFGCRVNVAICLQGASSPEPSTVYVDLRALRNDRVTLVERGSPHSLCVMESGKLLPGCKVIIANPETKGQCGDSHLGEIWVQSPHNASGYFTIFGDESSYADHFSARLVTGNTGEVYARTGYLGFLRRTENVQSDGELHDAVFVVGALDETIMLRGMRYHPIDIENSILRCHKKISECAVFTWTNLLVVVVELEGNESEALDVVPLVTNCVLEDHFLVVGVVVVVDPGVVPINSRGEKQRMHLRDGFLADQLDPIFVAYNM